MSAKPKTIEEARYALNAAVAKLEDQFMHHVRAAKTEQEAMAVYSRIPRGLLFLRAGAMDHFKFVSKIVPK